MIKPLNQKVLIEPIENSKKTKGGIIIPESVEDNPNTTGKILAISGQIKTTKEDPYAISIKVGDIVVFSKHHIDFINDEEGKVLGLVSVHDLKCVL